MAADDAMSLRAVTDTDCPITVAPPPPPPPSSSSPPSSPPSSSSVAFASSPSPSPEDDTPAPPPLLVEAKEWKAGRFVHLRPSWSTAFGSMVMVLREGAARLPHNVHLIRMVTDTSVPLWMPTLPPLVKVVDTSRPKGTWFCRRGDPVPGDMSDLVILYIHGGGFCLCTPGSHTAIVMQLAEVTGARIFAPHYRRPPEHPYPVPVEDCVAAYLHLLEVVGADPSRTVFVGDSAGGALVLQTMALARQRGLPVPAGACLLSPWVDLEDDPVAAVAASSSSSWALNAKYDYLPPGIGPMLANLYRGRATWDAVNPMKMRGEDLRGLPPLYVEAGECEVFLDQITAFVALARAHGAAVDYRVRRDMVHVHQMFYGTGMPQCLDSFSDIAGFCSRVVVVGKGTADDRDRDCDNTSRTDCSSTASSIS